MKVFESKVRLVAQLVVICSLIGIAPGRALGQATQPIVTVSPSHLSFALPTGSTPPTAAQTVTFSVTGSGTVNGIAASITGTPSGDFVIATDNCTGATLTAPAACTVNITFAPSLSPGNLENATLSIANSASSSALQVALTGAAGAIKLFDPLRINHSKPGTPGFPGLAVRTATVNLKSCPATPTATLSSKPDGKANVFQDNYIRVTRNPGTESPSQNVCTGGDPHLTGGGTNCFQAPYEHDFANYIGQDPDVAVSTGANGNPDDPAGTSLLPGFGVPPLDISGLLSPGDQVVEFELMDTGGELGAATLDLVTSCQQGGVQTNGSITGDPINPGSPGSLTPQFTFNNTTGQHITFAANYLTGENTTTFQANTIPTVKDVGIRPAVFPAMVAGTSAAPSTCMRFTGELDTDGVTPICKAFTITCTQDNSSTSSGTLCPQSTLRNLLFEAKFDSIDTPTSQSQIAPGTGPGFLMGSDTWTNGSTCSFVDAGDPLLGQLCPQDPLTEFNGAGDPISGSTPRQTNSTFIPVLNMPLPSTTVTVVGQNGAGWLNTNSFTVDFASSPASFPAGPQANGFVAAPILSLTYGIAPASVAVPDPTFPVAGDVTNPNNANNTACPTTTPGVFNSSAMFNKPDGQFTLHYFATDCANTEELNFTVSTNPKVNWASFKTVTIKIDTTKPTITGPTLTPAASGNIYKVGDVVTVNYSCADTGSGVATCAGPLPTGSHIDTSASQVGSHTFTVNAVDVAGNTASQAVTYQIVGTADLALLNLASPTVTAGDNLTYNIVVLNLGPSVADNVVVTDKLPANTTFVSASIGSCSLLGGCSGPPTSGTPCSLSGNVVTCSIPTVGLVSNFSAALAQVVVQVNAPVGSKLRDTAQVTEANKDPHPGNNTSTAFTKVTEPEDE
jgi:uncharacterized repeat protein (TIGR01451 family)